MRHAFALTLAVLFCAPAGSAQAAATNEVPASKQDVLKLFDVMHLRDQMKLVMEQVSTQMKSLSHEQLRKREPDITDEQIAKLDSQSDEILKGIPIDGMLEDMIPVYQKHLSKSDVNAMVDFYSTPVGQKILREMPAMTAEGMQAVQPRLRKEMDDAMNKIDKMARDGEEKKPASK